LIEWSYLPPEKSEAGRGGVKVDEKEFFREATLRICGSLDVENFLYESYGYVSRFVPADTVFLTYFDRDRGKHLALAKATKEGGTLLNLAVSMPMNLRSFVMRPDKQTLILDRAEAHPTSRPWIAQGLLENEASLIVLRLVVGEDLVGALVFHAKKSGVFSREHGDLISLLREPFAIALSNSIRYRELLRLKERLAEDNIFLHHEIRQMVGDEIVGTDFGLRGAMEMVRQVAPLSSPVLLLGETGTGKEVIAGAIHNLSPRSMGPMIKVNCGAIPETLMDSELFGHEKGAFTGALARKRGRFERANGGTVFLDEVGELHPEAQVRLLRVLQEKEIERVGGTGPVRVDIRVIAATNRDLKTMIRDGRFREDLYFRLNTFPIQIPPLRHRKGDLPSLVHHFVEKKSREIGVQDIPVLALGALERLSAYAWPGNIRELENAVERALILSRGEALDFRDYPEQERNRPVSGTGLQQTAPVPTDTLVLDEIISEHIRRVLQMTEGKVGGEKGAARLLEVNPSTLRKLMSKLGIPFGRKPVQKRR
jgi:transcriptional regulator with GAF, ATPase, and Fis domain